MSAGALLLMTKFTGPLSNTLTGPRRNHAFADDYYAVLCNSKYKSTHTSELDHCHFTSHMNNNALAVCAAFLLQGRCATFVKLSLFLSARHHSRCLVLNEQMRRNFILEKKGFWKFKDKLVYCTLQVR